MTQIKDHLHAYGPAALRPRAGGDVPGKQGRHKDSGAAGVRRGPGGVGGGHPKPDPSSF